MRKIAVVGATGLVGQALCDVAQEFQLEANWHFFASAKEQLRTIDFQGVTHPVQSLSMKALSDSDLVFMLTQSNISQPWIELLLKESNVRIIDNASTYRLQKGVPLLIPEVNPEAYSGQRLIANPNCVTIQLLLALQPVRELPLASVVLTSFQSVSGSGIPGLRDLELTQKGLPKEFYPHPIWGNVLPQCDLFDGDWTLEEKKILEESEKIVAPNYSIYPTCTRVPVPYGHQLSLTLTFEREIEKQELADCWERAARITFLHKGYALNTDMTGSSQVFVSRLRSIDKSQRVWQCWVGADNLRVGAATNALNIAAFID